MKREEGFKSVTRRQKVVYIYKQFGLVYLFKNYYKYAFRVVIALLTSFFRHVLIYLKYKKYEKLKLILTNNPTQKVSIIVPFRDTPEMLKVCIESILNKTDYKNYEIILVDNQSSLPETKILIDSLLQNSNIKLFEFNELFNYARLHNQVISNINTELVLLLNNDTEVISQNWLGHMVDIIENNTSVGSVGPLMVFHNNTIQHMGISLGVRYGLPYHIYEGLSYVDINSLPKEASGIREVSALTGACLLTRTNLYKQLGGLDEVNLEVAFNDIDFCLNLYNNGYHNVFTPNVLLYHYESYARGLDYLDRAKSLRLAKESNYFMKKWSKYKIDMFTGFNTICKIVQKKVVLKNRN